MEQNGTLNKNGSLTRRQLLALPYIASAPTVSEGARAARVGRSTLSRWMHDPAFRVELERLREGAASLAHAELQGLLLKSVFTLADLLHEADPRIRLRASRSALHIAIKAEESRLVRQRFEELDASLTRLRQQL